MQNNIAELVKGQSETFIVLISKVLNDGDIYNYKFKLKLS